MADPVRIDYPTANFLSTFAWVLRDHAELVSGAYKLRGTQQRDETGEWKDISEEEKLQQSYRKLTQRCHTLRDLADLLGK